MVKVELVAVGAEFVVAVEHQHVLDHDAVGFAVVFEVAHFISPSGSPIGDFQVFIGAADDLAPAGFVQAEQDVAVFVFIGGLHGGGVAGDNGVVIDGDGEARFLGGVDQPVHALGGVGVGINADGVVLSRGEGAQRKRHYQRQCKSQQFFHEKILPFYEIGSGNTSAG